MEDRSIRVTEYRTAQANGVGLPVTLAGCNSFNGKRGADQYLFLLT